MSASRARTPPLYRQRSVPVVPTGEPAIDKAIETVRKLVDDAESSEITKGRMVEGVTIQPAGVATVIEHKLGRQPSGWQIVDPSGDPPQVHRSAWDSKTITLVHGGAVAVTCKVWVF